MTDSDQEQKEQHALIKALPIWLQIIIGLVTVGGFIVAAINFFNPIGKVDLTVWVQQEVPVTLPTEIGAVPLILKYKEENINRATVLKVRILNSGSTPLGEKEQWALTLRTDEGSKIVVLANPETKPANINAMVSEGSSQNILPLQIGLLNPRDYIDLKLVIINPSNVEHPSIKPETRIPHLFEPTVTRETLEARLANAYRMPIFIFFTTLIYFFCIWKLIREFEGWVNKLSVAILLFLIAGFSSLFISTGLTWVLIKLALS